MPNANRCPQCRKQTAFHANYALRDLIKAQNPEAYAEREHEYNLTRSPATFVDEMRKTWPNTKVRHTKFDEKSTLKILHAMRSDLNDETKFRAAFGDKISSWKCTNDDNLQYSLKCKYSAVVEAGQYLYVVMSPRKTL